MRDFEPAKMKRVPFTGIRRVLEKANKLEAEGRKIVHFEVGQPDFDTPANIKEAAKKAPTTVTFACAVPLRRSWSG